MAQQELWGRWVVSDPITSADTNTTKPVINIPAKTLVTKVYIYVKTAFAGGTPSLDVGDTSDPDGWVDTTDITETSAGLYGASESNTGTTTYNVRGKYYSAAATIDAVVSASLTAGVAYVFAHMIDMADIL